jgi:hypothetical protein
VYHWLSTYFISLSVKGKVNSVHTHDNNTQYVKCKAQETCSEALSSNLSTREEKKKKGKIKKRKKFLPYRTDSATDGTTKTTPSKTRTTKYNKFGIINRES